MALRTVLLRYTKNIHYVSSTSIFTRYVSHNNYESEKDSRKKNRIHVAAALFGTVLFGAAVKEQLQSKQHVNKNQIESNKKAQVEAGEKRPDLPTYRADEVSKHDSRNSFWVIYKHGVYDVTKFLPSHPGGEQILNAGGLSIEPFWNVYGMHKTKEIFELLEQYRIGNIHEDDIADHTDDELWVKEPVRDKRLIVKTAKPFNAEIPPQYQVEYFDTPNELFYVRQHMPVPELDARTHSVVVVDECGGSRPRRLSLRDLGRLPRRQLRVALMCAGNRRSEMHQVKPVKGISWAGGAISNAVWGGVALRDLLLHCGVDLDDVEGKHVILTGADMDATGHKFSTSIPLWLAADPNRQVLLATHMNGQPLPADHGRPLRAVVPGAPAVRSVKWLESITISKEESSSHWHQKDYRSFNPSVTWETADFSTAPPVYSLPVTSAVCRPQPGDTVPVTDGCIEVAGYAYSGGGAKVLRVDVSADGGRSWQVAALRAADAAPPGRHYGWTLWATSLRVPQGAPEVEIWVKATDSNFNTQPEKFDDIWNIRGILGNAYHRVRVKLKH